MNILQAMNIAIPISSQVPDSGAALADICAAIPSPNIVVKIVSSTILHKTEAGGVAIVPNNETAVRNAIRDMETRIPRADIEAFALVEAINFDRGFGHELLLGYRCTRDFGPVLVFGPGGIHTEEYAQAFKAKKAQLSLDPHTTRAQVESLLRDNLVARILCAGLRGTTPVIPLDRLLDLLMTFLAHAKIFAAEGISDFEINPCVVQKAGQGNARFVALDALGKLFGQDDFAESQLVTVDGELRNSAQASRPLSKMKCLLEPRSAAIIGVSEKSMNNGRIILRNLIDRGFDTGRLYLIKPGIAQLEGCACVPDVRSLPQKVDLFIVVIPAKEAVGVLIDLIEGDKAEAIIVIPGGFEEKKGGDNLTERMLAALAAARALIGKPMDGKPMDGKPMGGGPLIVGGNCLGIVSLPGKYNTLFIPQHKLPINTRGADSPLAIISQSGAFSICRFSKNPALEPRYIITCGNQMDLTIGDFLDHLADDPGISVFAVYIEGCKPLDGEKSLAAIRRIRSRKGRVICYRAGRSKEGAQASASHTASIAGDWGITRALLTQAGAVFAESLDEFDDYLMLFSLFAGKKPQGVKLGAVSNAGFECVAIADNLGSLQLASLAPETLGKLRSLFEAARIGEIVDVHNPVDITPMANDATYTRALELLLEDPGVDCGIVGIVPMSPATQTLPVSTSWAESLAAPEAIAQLMSELYARSGKPWVAVVDAGTLYDPLAQCLSARKIPVFRTADRALRALEAWICH